MEDWAAGGQDVSIIWWHAYSGHAFIFQEKSISEELDIQVFVGAITMTILLNLVWKRFGGCNTKSYQRQSRERNYCSKRTHDCTRQGQFHVITGQPTQVNHTGGAGIRGQYQSIGQALPSFSSGRNAAEGYFAASQPASMRISLTGGQSISEHEPPT